MNPCWVPVALLAVSLLSAHSATDLIGRDSLETNKLFWDHEEAAKNFALENLKEILGFPARPPHPRKVPPYMMELYKTLATPGGQVRRRGPYNSTVVRSVMSHPPPKLSDSNSTLLLHFDVSGLATSEVLLGAELHLHKARTPHPGVPVPYYLVSVYQVVGPGPPEAQRLLTVQHSGPNAGPLVFNVRAAVDDWLSRSLNLGLAVVASPGVRVVHSHRRQPLLVLFGADRDRHRRRRSLPLPLAASSNRTGQCARRPLYVDFRALGWGSWIVSPAGFDADYCEGQCNFPLGQDQMPTNHAAVQSVVRELGLATVGTPCCVPDHLESLTMLLLDRDTRVVIKQYEDMVAKRCACH